MTKLELAYIAGLVDGDGSIFVSKRKTGTFRLFITISNSNTELIRVLEKLFLKGSVAWASDNYTAYHIAWEARQAQTVIRQILPYLKAKRKQAELATTFPHIGKGGNMKPGYLSTIRKQSRIYKQMRELNKKWSRGKVEGARK